MICRSNPKTRKRVSWCKNKATHLQFRSLNPTRIEARVINRGCIAVMWSSLATCGALAFISLLISGDCSCKISRSVNPSCKKNAKLNLHTSHYKPIKKDISAMHSTIAETWRI
jgi:hypothetical protein